MDQREQNNSFGQPIADGHKEAGSYQRTKPRSVEQGDQRFGYTPTKPKSTDQGNLRPGYIPTHSRSTNQGNSQQGYTPTKPKDSEQGNSGKRYTPTKTKDPGQGNLGKGYTPTKPTDPDQDRSQGREVPSGKEEAGTPQALDFIKPGQVIDEKYTVIEPLHQGGESVLYSCTDQDGNKLCIKFYLRVEGLKLDVRNKLLHLRHENILPLLAWGEWDFHIYEIFPLLPTGTLIERIKDGTTKNKEKFIVRQMEAAIHASHSVGIVHQDIKPENFLVSEAGDVKLIDFGISAASAGDNCTNVTTQGKTVVYASPEVLLSQKCSAATDYYSLGATIYALFFGVAPFSAYGKDDIPQLLQDMGSTRIPRLQELPQEWQDLIFGLMQAQPNQRWGHEAVEAWCKGQYDKYVIKQPSTHAKVSRLFSYAGQNFSLPKQADELASTMIKKWNITGLDRDTGTFPYLWNFTKESSDPQMAKIGNACNDSKRMEQYQSVDVCLFMMAYDIAPSLTVFGWRGCWYDDLVQFGNAMLSTLWRKEAAETERKGNYRAFQFAEGINESKTLTFDYLQEIIKYHLISYYLHVHGNDELSATLWKMESSIDTEKSRGLQEGHYRIAYLLSRSSLLNIVGVTTNDRRIAGVTEFQNTVNSVLAQCSAQNTNEPFHDLCSKIYRGGSVLPGFKVWAENQGFGAAVEMLCRSLQSNT